VDFSFKAGFPIFRFLYLEDLLCLYKNYSFFATFPRNFDQSSQTVGEWKENALFMEGIDGKANACQLGKTPKLSVNDSLCE
jgi:hypothetical protein